MNREAKAMSKVDAIKKLIESRKPLSNDPREAKAEKSMLDIADRVKKEGINGES